ncbi:MAG: bifunctional DNA-binding transcriptional regulator/O6-methylguanine-DNA methyltransferase Ada [Polyangiales bacterium]
MTARYESDDERWSAVCARDRAADGAFVYSVATTGVFCRPSCPSRRAKRSNVAFHEDASAAIALGFRPCLRCTPTLAGDACAQSMHAIARYIAANPERTLSLEALARRAALSKWHFQRSFKAAIGVSPKELHAHARSAKLARSLREGRPVLDAALEAGYRSTSRAYAAAQSRLAMDPSSYRAGAEGERIRFVTRETSLGWLILAATERGVCFVHFGDDAEALRSALEAEFSDAHIERSAADGSEALDEWMSALEAYLASERARPELPLDLRGTAFQLRVWRFLAEIREGETRTYTELARAIGAPSAVRAAASACAANRVAVLVPCHRILRADGSLAGYRWGVERKRALLDREREAKEAQRRAADSRDVTLDAARADARAPGRARASRTRA